MRVRESEVCGWEMARFSGHPLKPGIGEMLSINGTGVLLRKADSRFIGNKSRVPHISLVFCKMWDTTQLNFNR
jgi:hypothetical protein